MSPRELLEFAQWLIAHGKAGHFDPEGLKRFACDGWHFIKCLDCDGTGKAPTEVHL